jgi:hypothetical protein
MNGLHVGDGDLNINAGLDVDGRDVLDDLLGGEQVNHALEDLHLIDVPRVRTVTARGLTGGDLEGAGRQAQGTADLDLLVLGAKEQIAADLLNRLAIAAREGDANFVRLRNLLALVVLLDNRRHRSRDRTCCGMCCIGCDM